MKRKSFSVPDLMVRECSERTIKPITRGAVLYPKLSWQMKGLCLAGCCNFVTSVDCPSKCRSTYDTRVLYDVAKGESRSHSCLVYGVVGFVVTMIDVVGICFACLNQTFRSPDVYIVS
jgi:hypothetical protein